jgi:hypothetical protein
MTGLSKCCGGWVRPMIEWTGEDYKRTEDGWILIVEYQCQICHRPCEIKEDKKSC